MQTKFIMKPCFAGPNEDLILMGSENGKIIVWSKMQGTKLGELCGHEGVVNSIIVHPKISSIVISASDDNTIKTWNLLPS